MDIEHIKDEYVRVSQEFDNLVCSEEGCECCKQESRCVTLIRRKRKLLKNVGGTAPCMNSLHPLKSLNTNYAYSTATCPVRSGNAGPTRTHATATVNTAPGIMLAPS